MDRWAKKGGEQSTGAQRQPQQRWTGGPNGREQAQVHRESHGRDGQVGQMGGSKHRCTERATAEIDRWAKKRGEPSTGAQREPQQRWTGGPKEWRGKKVEGGGIVCAE
eukprot:1157968-Pelagomonas_calceolata.AAC.2